MRTKFKKDDPVYVVTFGLNSCQEMSWFLREWTVIRPTDFIGNNYEVKTIGFLGNNIKQNVKVKDMYKSRTWALKECRKRNKQFNPNFKGVYKKGQTVYFISHPTGYFEKNSVEKGTIVKEQIDEENNVYYIINVDGRDLLFHQNNLFYSKAKANQYIKNGFFFN